MGNGYSILWTDHALHELEATIQYSEPVFPEEVIRRLAARIEDIAAPFAQNPFLFSASDFENVRKVSILKHNTLYYKVVENEVQILSLFSNRQHPDQRL